MNILKSKHYPKIMYLLLIIVSLSLLFISVNILETANNKLKQKSLTGFAVNNEINQNIPLNASNISMNEMNNKTQQLYTSRSYLVFYVFLVGIISAIILTFLILRSTIIKNIEKEDNERRL